MTARGKVKGRVLYRVVTGGGYSVARCQTWVVTSIKRPPLRPALPWASPRAVMVYLQRGSGRRRAEHAKFPLAIWPSGYSATKRAAWRAAIPRLRRQIEIETVEQVNAPPDNEEWQKECRDSLRLLRRSLTKARKLGEVTP